MIRVTNVSVGIAGNRILHDVSVSVSRGETLAVLGESGVGKTTLLHALAGLRCVEHGTILIDGMPAADFARGGRLGYLFQRAVLSDWLTVEQNVNLPLRVGAAAGRADRVVEGRQVEHALDLAHISHAAHKYPRELSGGMRARAALAAALVRDPDLLLLDEPFSALDDIIRERVIVEVAPVLAAATSVLVTHSLQEALLLASRVVLLAGTPSGATIVAESRLQESRPRGSEYLDSTEAIETVRRFRALFREHASEWRKGNGSGT